MAQHRYISVAHYHAPFKQLPFQGLGAVDVRRRYYETAIFRAPYKTGYYQDNSLQGMTDALDLSSLPPAGPAWQRDLGTAMNQVPPWGYGLLSAAFLGMGYIAYKRWKKGRAATTG